MNLEGKVALITGAGKGVGQGIAEVLAGYGVKIGLNYNSSEEEAKEVKDKIEKSGGEVILLKTDVSQSAQVKLMAEKLADKYGKIDILVNNAAVQKNLWLREYSIEDYELVMSVNLKGYMLCMQAVLPYMRTIGAGRIINISSIHSKRPTDFDPVYSMAKGGVKMLTRESAIEFAKYGITVNAIELGAIEIGTKTGNPRSIRTKVNPSPFRKYPVGRYGTPQEVGHLTAYLASEESAFMNGTSIRFDGGRALV
jgi:glucose 1-dehydrogenase